MDLKKLTDSIKTKRSTTQSGFISIIAKVPHDYCLCSAAFRDNKKGRFQAQCRILNMKTFPEKYGLDYLATKF